MCTPISHEAQSDQTEHLSDKCNDHILVSLSSQPLSSSRVIDFVKDPACGAVVYFGGTTRDSMDSKSVVQLSYEAYIPMALKTLSRVAQETLDKWSDSVKKVAIIHRLGDVPVMQESVVIAVSAKHRQQGWQAGEYILEEIKKSAEIWKSESYTDGGSVWRSNKEDEQIKRS